MESEPLSPFGEILRTFRRRQPLTQQQVAAELGMHRNTIGSWEHGDFLPESKGIVLELARVLHLDDQETRQLLEASLTALAPYWNVPYPRNPLFTGRGEILDTLHQRLSPNLSIASTQSHAIYGLGGIGKTQLAVEYAYRYALEYTAIFWITAESDETIMGSFLALAEMLQLPERREADQQRIVVAVQQWLSSHKEWLLIWDNLEDLELLLRFLPPARQGTMLITTWRQALGTLAQGIKLSPMEPEEGMIFLLKRAKLLSPEATREQVQQLAARLPTEYAAARELVTLMGGLPLAFDQAGAYIEETGCGLSDYLERFEKQRTYFLDRRGAFGGNHPQSVTATFRLLWQRIEQEQSVAADLLRIAAFLHAEAIPEEIFLGDASSSTAMGSPIATDPTQLDLAIATLRSLSLVQRQAELHTLSIHRLVQAVLREEMHEQEREQWQQRTLRILHALFPEFGTRDSWKQCERLLPHVLTIAAAIPDHIDAQNMADLLRKAADYLRRRAQYEQAEELYLRALHIWEEVVGPEYLHLAFPLDGLAALYREQGKYEQAEAFYQQALHIREQRLGPEHLDLTRPLNGLALLYYEQGKYKQAEPLYQRALRIRERELGPQHSEVASLLSNLANLYAEQGKYEQAEPLYERALCIWEEALGSEHPDVAYALNNLAFLYYEQGKYEQAEPLHQRALLIWEKALGPKHPHMAYSLDGLASLYREQGKYAQAEELYQRALHIWEEALGPEHQVMASSLNGLATLLVVQGRYKEAEPFYQRALIIREHHLGQHHPDTAQTLSGLATCFQKQGRLVEAASLSERALLIGTQSLGDLHPKTIAMRTQYAELRHMLKQRDNHVGGENRRSASLE